MQVSKVLRLNVGDPRGGYIHWCPGCDQDHTIFTKGSVAWDFDGNLECPSFDPSIRITGKKIVVVDGKWTGELVRDADGNTVDHCCHYFIKAGKIEFCNDSTHELSDQTVVLPDLPNDLKD